MLGQYGVYAVVQDKKKFYEKLWSDQMIIIMLVIASIMIVIFGVVFLSRFLIRKVKKINDLLYEKELYDLESIENGIQSLIREGEEKDKMALSIKKMYFIRRFINGEMQEREVVLSEAGNVQLNVDYDRYIVALLRQEEGWQTI